MALKAEMMSLRKIRWTWPAQCALGCAGLALITFLFFRLDANAATTGFAYVILVAIASALGSLTASILLSIAAAACLNYFFVPPLFSFRVDYAQDALAIAAFMTTSLIITALTTAVRRSAEAAQESHRALIDTIPALIWTALPDGSLDFSKSGSLVPSDISATSERNNATMLHPDDRNDFARKWRSAVESGKLFEALARVRNAAGEYRATLVRAAPLHDQSGDILRWYGVSTDVEDRRRAVEALRDSEEQWKAVFANSPTMYFMIDAAGTILSVNPYGAEQLGYSVDELIARPVLNVFYGPDREVVQRNTAACLEAPGRAMGWELRKMRKDGSMLWVRETARAMLMKGRLVVLIVCEDITERKRAEYLTGRVFETYPDGICVVGRDYRLQRANPVYAQNVGVPAEKLVGMHGADLLGANFFENTLKPNYDRCLAGEAVSYSAWFEYPRGRRFIAVSYSPLQPESEQVEAILVITRDLTEHVLADEALRLAQAGLAHANRVSTMGQLTASIAHEVNQPITAAVINAQAGLHWLSVQPPDLDEARAALAAVLKEGIRAGEVIGRIRTLIKRAPPRKELFAINDAILEVVSMIRAEAANDCVSVQTDLADGLPLVQGDRVQLQQVILNLVINAIEAMRSPGEESKCLLVCTRKAESGGVLIEVRDSGPGFATAAVEHLFEAFHTTKSSGLGLGLSICRSIVEAHNGRLWVSKNEHRGAAVHFTVPIEPPAESL